MQVPSSDVEFITNIRKAVVQGLRLEPVIANLGGMKADNLAGLVSNKDGPQAFSLEEETLFGRCQSEYTLTKVPKDNVHSLKQLIERDLKTDEQTQNAPRSFGGRLPKLAEEYWQLVRAINFDKCSDRVILQVK